MTLNVGFAKSDITPRVGVELCGFGPFLNRHSTGIHDRLWARVMAVRSNECTAVVIACDLIGVAQQTTDQVRELLNETHGLPADSVMICCSHTHSGPAPGVYIGWGDADYPYLEVLPHRIARAAVRALDALQPAVLQHAEVPCEGIGQNREYDEYWAAYEEALEPAWRPAKPELTDTTCHVLTARATDDRLLGFVSYFGCHPVVCCANTHQIHGDYPGVALNRLGAAHPGSVGLFLQGAQGDVNTPVGCNDDTSGLKALDVIADRFACAVQQGIDAAEPIEVQDLSATRHQKAFSRKPWTRDEIQRRLCVENCHTPTSTPSWCTNCWGWMLNLDQESWENEAVAAVRALNVPRK